MSATLPLSFPVVAHSPAVLSLDVSALELEFFVFLGTASSVLRLGLPLFLLCDKKQSTEGGKRGY